MPPHPHPRCASARFAEPNMIAEANTADTAMAVTLRVLIEASNCATQSWSYVRLPRVRTQELSCAAANQRKRYRQPPALTKYCTGRDQFRARARPADCLSLDGPQHICTPLSEKCEHFVSKCRLDTTPITTQITRMIYRDHGAGSRKLDGLHRHRVTIVRESWPLSARRRTTQQC